MRSVGSSKKMTGIFQARRRPNRRKLWRPAVRYSKYTKLQNGSNFPSNNPRERLHRLSTRASPSAQRHVLRCRAWPRSLAAAGVAGTTTKRKTQLSQPCKHRHQYRGERAETATCVPVPHAGSRPGPYPGKTRKFIATEPGAAAQKSLAIAGSQLAFGHPPRPRPLYSTDAPPSHMP
jgi:hypothetical protein